jgi:hypothetical protein
MLRPRSLALAVVAVAVLPWLAPAAPAEAAKRRPALEAFTSCGQIVDYGTRKLHRVRRQGSRAGTPMLPPATGGGTGGGAEGGGGGMPAPAPGAPVGGPVADGSATNVQEAGIDEPDVVKSDGSTLFALADGRLHALDARAQTPARLGTLDLPGDGYDHVMLRDGNRLLVMHREWAGTDGGAGGGAEPAGAVASSMPAYYGHPVTVLSEVDVSAPQAMAVTRTYRADGALVSARQSGRTARLVLRATPPAVREEGGTRRVSRWLPRATLRDRRTGRRKRARMVRCRSVRRPRQFSGLDTLTVLTVDLARGLPAVDSDAILIDADTVYGSAQSLYVATQRWVRALEQPPGERSEVPEGMTTALHRFDASAEGRTAYRASGRVPGFLLSQWSLSEHEGVLRVASTEEPPWWGDRDDESHSSVTTLAERDGALHKLGSVGGLGRGERIYAVRFIGDIGFVVTFRQVDPLYTVDLSDPAAPEVLGELKIPGYSAYLHPVGEDRLLGVGQDATDEGRRLGAQVSLFDVSDLRNPRRVATHGLGEHSHTEVEWNHLAFLWWPATRLAVVPFERYHETSPFTGAAGLTVSADGITELGRVSHPAPGGNPWSVSPIRRSVVVGDRLFTVGYDGVQASRLDDLSTVGWVPFSRG